LRTRRITMRSLSENLEIQLVWEKGIAIRGLDPSKWRWDANHNLIYRWAYGDRSSPYGWEKDHINPWGSDEISNLQPLQWLANVEKGARRLVSYQQVDQGWAQSASPCTTPDQPFPNLLDYFDPPKRKSLGDLLDEMLSEKGANKSRSWSKPLFPWEF
jgi:hypothetical protein